MSQRRKARAVDGEGDGQKEENASTSGQAGRSGGADEFGQQPFAVQAEMRRGENKAPVGEKHMSGSERKVSLEPDEGERRLGNGNRARQRAEQGKKQQRVQREPDGAQGVVSAFAQGFIPGDIPSRVQQRQGDQAQSQPFVNGVACVAIGHQQKKQREHEDVSHRFDEELHILRPFFERGGGTESRCAPRSLRETWGVS